MAPKKVLKAMKSTKAMKSMKAKAKAKAKGKAKAKAKAVDGNVRYMPSEYRCVYFQNGSWIATFYVDKEKIRCCCQVTYAFALCSCCCCLLTVLR